MNGFSKLTDEELVNHLNDRLAVVIKAYQEEQLADLIKEATIAVERAESNPTSVNKLLANQAIDRLTDGEVKDALISRMNELDASAVDMKLQQQIEDAESKVIALEAKNSMVNRILAERAINNLPDGQAKDELQARYNKVINP